MVAKIAHRVKSRALAGLAGVGALAYFFSASVSQALRYGSSAAASATPS